MPLSCSVRRAIKWLGQSLHYITHFAKTEPLSLEHDTQSHNASEWDGHIHIRTLAMRRHLNAVAFSNRQAFNASVCECGLLSVGQPSNAHQCVPLIALNLLHALCMLRWTIPYKAHHQLN